MKPSYFIASSLLGGALVIGCLKYPNDDLQASTTTATTTTSATTSDGSGSVTSAPGSTTAPDVTTSGSATTTPTTVGSSSEPCSFLDCDDMTGSDECDTWTQDCPEGQKCTYYAGDGGGSWDATKCVDVTGTDKVGEECTAMGALSGFDSCIEGAICWGIDGDGIGTCVEICSGSPEAPTCEPPNECYFSRLLTLCFFTCDPLLQDCSDPAEACYPIGDTFNCAPDASGKEGQASDSCAFINTCDKGLMCADAEFVGAGCIPPATGCCTPFCEFPNGPCPNADQQCVQYFDPAALRENDPQLNIGVCGLPG